MAKIKKKTNILVSWLVKLHKLCALTTDQSLLVTSMGSFWAKLLRLHLKRQINSAWLAGKFMQTNTVCLSNLEKSLFKNVLQKNYRQDMVSFFLFFFNKKGLTTFHWYRAVNFLAGLFPFSLLAVSNTSWVHLTVKWSYLEEQRSCMCVNGQFYCGTYWQIICFLKLMQM